MSILCPARAALLLAVTFAAAALPPAAAQRSAPKFYDDDPIARLEDTQDASNVQEREISLTYDAIINLFGRPGQQTVGRAESVNTIDEVPDSSWYTNRRPLTAEEITRGINDDVGPAPGTWTVSRKSSGVSPGFTITDPRGSVYFVKFDPPGEPELGTGAEAVVARFYHALGYNTAQVNVGTLRREQLVVGKDAVVRLPSGASRPMNNADIDEQLRRAHQNPDGSYRASFGSRLPGRPVEGFKYEGTRSDDPNDVIPHENRRELRALRVVGAWVNHTDAKALNSLDTVLSENGRTFVRHYVRDFNATLGSAGVAKRERRDGYEYIAEIGPAKKALTSFGFFVRPWMMIEYPASDLRGVGRFEARRFVPEEWRPRVPNPAYVRSRPDDTFWGARKLMTVTDDLVRAALKAGKYTDPRAEQFLTEALIERRHKIARAWLTNVNPIVDPAITGSTLSFGNAAVRHAGASAPSGYRATWYRFNNLTREVQRIGETQSASERMTIPADVPTDTGFIRVDLSATHGAHVSWASPVHVYFRRVADAWKLVGFERMPNAPPMRPGLVGAEPIECRMPNAEC
jgi:hypothetical protein